MKKKGRGNAKDLLNVRRCEHSTARNVGQKYCRWTPARGLPKPGSIQSDPPFCCGAGEKERRIKKTETEAKSFSKREAIPGGKGKRVLGLSTTLKGGH